MAKLGEAKNSWLQIIVQLLGFLGGVLVLGWTFSISVEHRITAGEEQIKHLVTAMERLSVNQKTLSENNAKLTVLIDGIMYRHQLENQRVKRNPK